MAEHDPAILLVTIIGVWSVVFFEFLQYPPAYSSTDFYYATIIPTPATIIPSLLYFLWKAHRLPSWHIPIPRSNFLQRWGTVIIILFDAVGFEYVGIVNFAIYPIYNVPLGLLPTGDLILIGFMVGGLFFARQAAREVRKVKAKDRAERWLTSL